MFPISHEGQVKVIIDRLQDEAVRARPARLARGNQSARIATAGMSLRALITTMVGIIRVSLRQKPAARQEPVAPSEPLVSPEAGAEPVDTPVVA